MVNGLELGLYFGATWDWRHHDVLGVAGHWGIESRIDLFLINGRSVLILIIIVDYISKQVLKRLEPHRNQGPNCLEPVHIGRVVKLLIVSQVSYEPLSEIVAIVGKRVVFHAVPEVPEMRYDVVYLVLVVVGHACQDLLFESETSTVALVNFYDTTALEIMASVGVFVTKYLN